MSIIVIFTDPVLPGLQKTWDRPNTVRPGPEYLAELLLIDAQGMISMLTDAGKTIILSRPYLSKFTKKQMIY